MRLICRRIGYFSELSGSRAIVVSETGLRLGRQLDEMRLWQNLRFLLSFLAKVPVESFDSVGASIAASIDRERPRSPAASHNETMLLSSSLFLPTTFADRQSRSDVIRMRPSAPALAPERLAHRILRPSRQSTTELNIFPFQLKMEVCLLLGLLIASVGAQSNYAAQANDVEYAGEGLPEQTVLNGKVTKTTTTVL